jgi:hypothetical protein
LARNSQTLDDDDDDKGDTRVPADNGDDISLKDEDVRNNETYIKDNDSKFGGN